MKISKLSIAFIALALCLGFIAGIYSAQYIVPPAPCPACPQCPDPEPELVVNLQSLDWGEIRKLKRVTINWNPQMEGTFIIQDAKAEARTRGLDTMIYIRPSGQAAQIQTDKPYE